MFRKTDLTRLRDNYFFAARRALEREARFSAFFRKSFVEALEVFAGTGLLMMARTAFTRSELTPRIWPISSGVGTGLVITYGVTRSL